MIGMIMFKQSFLLITKSNFNKNFIFSSIYKNITIFKRFDRDSYMFNLEKFNILPDAKNFLLMQVNNISIIYFIYLLLNNF